LKADTAILLSAIFLLSNCGVTLNENASAETSTPDMGSDFTAANICSGKTIFGTLGSAVCNSVFGDLVGSNAHRNVNASQITLKDEIDNGLDTGYRAIPDVSKDDDGYWTSAAGCTAAGGSANTCTTVVKATRPTVDCGSSGEIEDRITDCVTANPSASTWDGSVKGLGGEGTWKLVTRISSTTYPSETQTYEVWRDERTGLVWSDQLGNRSPSVNKGRFNWCLASGNTQGGYGVECQVATAGSYNNAGVSLCYDDGAGSLITPNGMHNATTATNLAAWDSTGLTDSERNNIVRAKGALTSLTWRLPTKADWMQAEVNGVRHVLPNLGTEHFWSASVSSKSRSSAWFFIGYNGFVSSYSVRSDSFISVRCVGR
jgi:hypothetical protein